MNRREFAWLLGCTVAWPLGVQAQQRAMPVVGYLHSGPPGPFANLLAAFHRGLNESGFVEGRNVAFEYRWAEGHYDRLPALAADLVRRQVSVIAAAGGSASVLAAKEATATIPIVFSSGGDPISLGFVSSLSRPEGNVTGVNIFTAVMEGKRFGLLRELAPDAALFGVLLNPSNPPNKMQLEDVQQAARAIGQPIHALHASTAQELDTAFTTLVQLKVGALLVAADPFFNGRRDQIVALAARHRIIAIYEQREFVVAGGLMSYGTRLSDAYRQVGAYTARVLNGEKPGDLPVVQPVKFEFVINFKTAKALGVDVPPALSARADEVIE